KIIVSLLFTTLIIVSAYLLWQRQPKGQLPGKPDIEPATQEAESDNTPKLIDSPKNNSISSSTNIKFSGQSLPNTFFSIYTNDVYVILKTDDLGKFEKELSVPAGLQFIRAQSFNGDLTPDKNQDLTMFISGNQNGDEVQAGVVKTIFDTVITIATGTADKDIKTTKSTQFTTPKDEEVEATTTAEDLVRVGDFIIAIGSSKNNKNLDAKSIEIIRGTTPHNSERLVSVKILGPVAKNSFSAANIADSQNIQFALDNNSTITKEDKSTTTKEITKDKRGFIFYHIEGDKNIVDTIRLI
ncbi:MAG: hypothetical protein Q8P25_01980, partial [Candidatus Curtissbacteria bacterium]|nr:hypothetical protein [Candidatus Curtissbacteria bacterium]